MDRLARIKCKRADPSKAQIVFLSNEVLKNFLSNALHRTFLNMIRADNMS